MLALCIVKKLSTEKNGVYQRIIHRASIGNWSSLLSLGKEIKEREKHLMKKNYFWLSLYKNAVISTNL